MRHITSLGLVLLLAPLVPSRAQSPGDTRAFIALRASNIGALTPLLTPAMIGRRLNGAQLGLRYGLRDEGGVRTNSIAASGIFSIGMQSSWALTAGVSDADCVDCNPTMMLGIGGDMRIMQSGDFLTPGAMLNIGVSGDFSYARLEPGSGSALALGVGAPITLAFGAATSESGLRFAPFFVPVFGVGQTSVGCGGGSCEESGVRFLLGGGIGVWNPASSISATLGINQVLFPDAKPVFGVNVQIGGR